MSYVPILSTVLPELWSQVSELAAELQANVYDDWPPLNARLAFLSEAGTIETIEKRVPGWQKMATLQNGATARHTILVLAVNMTLPEYQQASSLTRNEIDWAALLHDIDKEVLGGRDSAHPFRSAAAAVKALQILGFDLQPNVAAQELEEWATLVMSSQRDLGGQTVHDHAHLQEIVGGIHSHWGQNTSGSRILKAVLFHQSLPTINDWMNPVLLDDEELCRSLSISDMEILGPLLIADSDAWDIFHEQRFAYLDELRANVTETRRRIWGK
jgi:hypothetical protein